MNKASVVCEACGENNPPTSEFCIGCGTKLIPGVPPTQTDEQSEEEKKFLKEKKIYYQSLPYLIVVIPFLFFIDYVDDKSIQWAFYPGVAILLFAIIAPYFKFRGK